LSLSHTVNVYVNKRNGMQYHIRIRLLSYFRYGTYDECLKTTGSRTFPPIYFILFFFFISFFIFIYFPFIFFRFFPPPAVSSAL